MGTERDLEVERDSERGSCRDRERRKGKTGDLEGEGTDSGSHQPHLEGFTYNEEVPGHVPQTL